MERGEKAVCSVHSSFLFLSEVVEVVARHRHQFCAGVSLPRTNKGQLILSVWGHLPFPLRLQVGGVGTTTTVGVPSSGCPTGGPLRFLDPFVGDEENFRGKGTGHGRNMLFLKRVGTPSSSLAQARPCQSTALSKHSNPV